MPRLVRFPALRTARACLAVGTGVLLAAGCTGHQATPEPTASPPPAISRTQAQTQLPADPTLILDAATPADLAIVMSRSLFVHAPAVVLLAVDDAVTEQAARATSISMDLGVPLLLTPGGGGDPGPLRGEVERLEPHSLVAVGEAAATWARTEATPASATPASATAPAATAPATTAPATTAPAPAREVVDVTPDAVDSVVLPAVTPPPALDGLLVLAPNAAGAGVGAAVATARAAGARVVGTDGADPRADGKAVAALAGAATAHVVAIGAAFGPADRLRRRVETAATGVQLPGGGQVVFPGRRMVALYGHPGDSGLGSLGEQGLPEAVARAQQVASAYAGLGGGPVVPAFEMIATVASSGPGPDGDYSSESSVDFLRPWVDAAQAAGMYVVLDLQPGRTDFLTQAQRYADLLALPNVGLALDPEWRLKPDQRHLEQIGSVTADEINRTGRWLADLTRDHKLPQKIMMIHQFRLDMITDRSTLVTDYDELSVVIHADGFGSAGQKFNTWNALHQGEPANIFWGWKNFYDEDKPTFTPQETVAVAPSPVFISYQ